MGGFTTKQGCGYLPFNLYSLDPSMIEAKYLQVWPIAVPMTRLARWWYQMTSMRVSMVVSIESEFSGSSSVGNNPVQHVTIEASASGGGSASAIQTMVPYGKTSPVSLTDRMSRILGQWANTGGSISWSSASPGFQNPFPPFTSTDYTYEKVGSQPSGSNTTTGTGGFGASFAMMYPQYSQYDMLGPGPSNSYNLGDQDYSVIRKPDQKWYPSLVFMASAFLGVGNESYSQDGNPNLLGLVTSIPPSNWRSGLGWPLSAGGDPNNPSINSGVPAGQVGTLRIVETDGSGESYVIPLYGYTGASSFIPADAGLDGGSSTWTLGCNVTLNPIYV